MANLIRNVLRTVTIVFVAAILFTSAEASALVPPPDGGGAASTKTDCQKAVDKKYRPLCLTIQVLGHRGIQDANSSTNENTIYALQRDHTLGVGFETDTPRLASDDGTPNAGISVIFHDPTLGRVVSAASLKQAGLTAQTNIGTVTYAQFQLLRTNGGQPLATLQQWIQNAGKWQVPGMIELKYAPGNPAQVAGWVKQYNAPVTFYAQPQDPAGKYPCFQTGANAMMAVGVTVGLKYTSGCPMSLQDISNDHYAYVITAPSTITRDYVNQAHQLGIKVGDYDSGDATTWAQLVNAGADYILAPHPGPAEKWATGHN